MHEPGRQAGNAGGPRAVGGPVAVQSALGIQILIRRCRGRCGFAGIDEMIAAGFCLMQQKEAAAAQTRADRLDHRKRGRNRNGGIESVAALGQDFQSGIGRQVMRGSYGMLVRPGRWRRFGSQQAGGEQQRQQQMTEFHALSS